MAKSAGKKSGSGKTTERYTHPYQTVPMRPEIGTQAQFRKKKPPQLYRYDSSLSPALDWDGQHGARELGEWLLGLIDKAAALPAPHAFAEPQEPPVRQAGGHVRPVRRSAPLDRRPGAARLRAPGQVGEPPRPRRLAAVGPSLDHDRHEPRAARPRAPASAHGHVSRITNSRSPRTVRPAASSTCASRTRRAKKSAASSRT